MHRKQWTYYSADRTKKAWWDPALRLWTILEIDERGDQLIDKEADYQAHKFDMLAQLGKGWTREEFK